MERAFFRCDLAGARIPLVHVWEHTIGSGHATLALRADWQAQLQRCHVELGIRRVRFHGLLSDDIGSLVRQHDRPLYSFFNVDRIWDFLLSIGMQPFVELSFMPRSLASGRATVFRYEGNVTPPRSVRTWAELVTRLAMHAVDRYGRTEVRDWNFEVWNEPNLRSFWRGTQRDYFNLYSATARALKHVEAAVPVGGPATAENGWLAEFLHFCKQRNVPADFISTHYYPTDPTKDFSSDTEEQLAASRRGILCERASSARGLAGDRPLYYTEWNTSSNDRDPLHDEPYAAAFIAKTLLEVAGIVDAYAFWTFSDIFEESYFPSAPFHGGFGLLTLHGVAKPAYRAFELLHRLGSELVVPVDGMHPTVNCWVVRDDAGRVNIMLTNHALPRHQIDDVSVWLRLDSAASSPRATIARIDDEHANPKGAWIEMGSPEYLTDRQLTALHDASTLSRASLELSLEDSTISCRVNIPRHGVALLTIE